MQPNTLYIVPKGTFGDKNDNLQFRGSKKLWDLIKAEVRGIGQYNENPKFYPLSLFIQGVSRYLEVGQWIMIEHWSFNVDLFFEFCEYISIKFSLPLEIGLK